MPQIDIQPILDGLNPEQAAAVTVSAAAPVLVLAGAGCGKTTVLTRRIAFLAREYCPGDNILALTFTRAAAREMAQRVALFKKDNSPTGAPLITTFHAFCLRFLFHTENNAPLYRSLGYATRPRLVSATTRFRMIAETSTREERSLLCMDVLELSALVARRAVFPQATGGLSAEALSVAAAVESRYVNAKKERGLWDFSDFISGALTLIETHPVVSERFLSRFRAILVDEFQDTNPAQVELLKGLLRPEKPLFAVGDDDQAIYGFQGADRKTIMEFEARFPGATILKLQTNYRSTAAILTAANRVFRDKPKDFRKVLVTGLVSAPALVKKHAPRKINLESEEAMASWLVTTMVALKAEHGISYSDCAVLFRLNQTLDKAAETLTAAPQFSSERPQLLTVHGSKGLEFDAVFLCDLEEGVFPKKKARAESRSLVTAITSVLWGAKDDADELGEEKRLFYVGITRAKRFLWLVSVRKKELYGRTRQLEPSRFLRLV
jgi:DNA helicase-2/ATP-dependent DNA helicase PcrA